MPAAPRAWNLAPASRLSAICLAQACQGPDSMIAMLARSLSESELLSLDAETILHRLFWDEPLARMVPSTGQIQPRFACTCSRERVAGMLRNLGQAEVQDILAEQGQIEVDCDFCGAHYHFDPIDAAAVFMPDSHAGGADGAPH